MNYKTSLIAGILFGGLGVALGAFGAHALKPVLEANGRIETFELAVRYQFFHAFALISCGILMVQLPALKLTIASLCFTLGIIIFSGSLYVLSLSGITVLGAITPLGGVLFLAGWCVMLAQIIKLNSAGTK